MKPQREEAADPSTTPERLDELTGLGDRGDIDSDSGGLGGLSASGRCARVERRRGLLGLPLHGSRFAADGGLLEGPAVRGLDRA